MVAKSLMLQGIKLRMVSSGLPATCSQALFFSASSISIGV